MNQEQLNTVVDIYNNSKKELYDKGEYFGREDPVENTVASILAALSCYLYVYKDLFPDKYPEAKKILQNITDMITIGVDIEKCAPQEGEFSMENQHLICLGGNV